MILWSRLATFQLNVNIKQLLSRLNYSFTIKFINVCLRFDFTISVVFSECLYWVAVVQFTSDFFCSWKAYMIHRKPHWKIYKFIFILFQLELILYFCSWKLYALTGFLFSVFFLFLFYLLFFFFFAVLSFWKLAFRKQMLHILKHLQP